MVEQGKDHKILKGRQGTGGRVQIKLEIVTRGNKRPENSEKVEFKVGEKDIVSRLRGNKRPEQRESTESSNKAR